MICASTFLEGIALLKKYISVLICKKSSEWMVSLKHRTMCDFSTASEKSVISIGHMMIVATYPHKLHEARLTVAVLLATF